VLFPFGSWVHIILWWDGTKLKFFLNNQEVTNSINAKGLLSGDGGIRIGGENELGSGFYNGAMDDFRFYAHAITPMERDDCYLGVGSPLVTSYGEEYYLEIETLRGPSDFNATGLPEGLKIDTQNGIIFGTSETVGTFEVLLQAWNSSGMDEENMTLYVLPGEQSILANEIGLLRYGDPPLDLNWTATSGLPVQIEILEGNESVDLNSSLMPCKLTILQPGVVKLLATQPGDGNSTFGPAKKIIEHILIAKKELIVRVENHSRKSIEDNPPLTYEISGFAFDDNESQFSQNIDISLSTPGGSIETPTPAGEYPILASNGFSEKYFFSYIQGTLTVSDKLKQELVFDQNLTDISSLSDKIRLTGSSIDAETTSTTSLPLYYEVENSEVARLSVTQELMLKSHWKLDEVNYAEASDELLLHTGSVNGLQTTGSNNAWQPAKFSNGLLLDGVDGLVDFGPLQLDSNFTFSFWARPEENATAKNEMTLLSKKGVNSMNHFRLFKNDGNGTIGFDLFTDGNNSATQFNSSTECLVDNHWTHFALTYNGNSGALTLFANAEPIISHPNLKEANNALPYSFRFSNLILGAASNSFHGLIDDLRLYSTDLNSSHIEKLYNLGGGDYHTLEIIGFGQSKITAFQQGNTIYEKAIPVSNYLTVNRSSQSITFNELPNRSVGDFPFSLQATSSSGLPIIYSLSDLSRANISQNIITIRNAGVLTVTASQPGNEKFLPADDVSQTFSIEYGNLFSDSVPGLSLWLDANDVNHDGLSDSSSDFLPGNLISLWSDRSGRNNSPVQANYAKMPSWVNNALYGKAVVSFDSNSSQTLELRQSISDPQMIFTVMRTKVSSNARPLGGDLLLSSSSGFFQLSYNNESPVIQSAKTSDRWSIVVAGFDTGSQNLWINGDLIGSSSSSILPTPLQNIGELFSGEIAETLVYENQFTFNNRLKVEAYLAHKWGLQDQLPSLHPYHEKPPAFGGDQFITWFGIEENETFDIPRLPVKSFGDEVFPLNAEASSGLPILFASDDPTTLSISANFATILSPGKVRITAYQNGNSKFFAAEPQTIELEIVDFNDPLFEKDDQNITFSEIPLKVREDPPFQIFASASSSGENHRPYSLPVIFQIVSGPATIDGRGIISLTGEPGTVVVSATQSGNAFVKMANPVLRSFEVSTKTRPSILFLDQQEDDSNLQPLLFSARPISLPGVITSNGKRVNVVSSNTDVVEVLGNSKIVARKPGEVTLTFYLPEDEEFAQAVNRTRKVEVIRPTKDAWINNRKNDPRYASLKNKYLSRKRLSASPMISEESLITEFDNDQADSDGDGYSNLFERALGMDSLGFDRSGGPSMMVREDHKPSISFIRYSNPLLSTGEEFSYLIEQSTNLLTWTSANVDLVSRVYLGEGQERVTYVLSGSADNLKTNFLRLRISSP